MEQNQAEALKKFWQERQDFFKERFDRFLPFGDLVSDRWEKARRLGFGQGSSVYDQVVVIGDVTVGEMTWIGPGVVLDGSGGPLRIGSHCSLSAGVQIYTHDSVKWAVTGGRAPYIKGAVAIGDQTYIGPNSIICQGVEIGRQVIIGAQSLVTSSIPNLTAAWGQPARIQGQVVLNEDETDYSIIYNQGGEK